MQEAYRQAWWAWALASAQAWPPGRFAWVVGVGASMRAPLMRVAGCAPHGWGEHCLTGRSGRAAHGGAGAHI